MRRRVVTPEAGAVCICADPKVGGRVAIEAANSAVQVPCANRQAAALTFASQEPTAWHDAPLRQGCDASAARPPFQQPTFWVSQPSQGTPQSLDICQDWRQGAAELASESDAAPTVAIVGNKQSGKSSFGRLLVNSLLNTWPLVAFLDTDCGQAEFTPPGDPSESLPSSHHDVRFRLMWSL